MAKPVKKKRMQDALAFLDTISQESVEVAKDQNVSVTPADQPAIKEDAEEKVIPKEEVDASVEATPTKTLSDTTQDGHAQTQDVGKVSSTLETTKGNDEETNHVDGKTPDEVGAGTKDLTKGVISQEENIETSEAEHIPTDVDEAVMDVGDKVKELEATGITQATDAAVDRIEEVEQELDSYNRVEAALEEYSAMLAGRKARGQAVDKDLAESIRIGLRSHSKSFFAATVPALEAFDGGLAGTRATISLERAIGESLKDMGTAAKNAAIRIIEMIIDAWNSLTRDTTKLVSEIDRVQKKMAAGLKTGEEVTIKSAGRLMVNGEFVGDSVQHARNVEAVSRELLVEWPMALKKVIDVIESGSKEVATGADNDKSINDRIDRLHGQNNDIIEAVESAVSATFKEFKEDRDGNGSGIITRSPILPGNKAMYISVGHGDEGGVAPFKFEFKSAGDAGSGSATFTVPSADRARMALNAVKGIVTNVIAKDSSLAAMKELRGKLASNKDTGKGKLARQAISEALSQHRQFMGYLISLVKAYIAVFDHMSGQGAIEDNSGETIDQK